MSQPIRNKPQSQEAKNEMISDISSHVNRPDHCFLGSQLVPAAPGQALHLDRHRKYDRQHGHHLRLVYVPSYRSPTVYSRRDCKYCYLSHGRASGVGSAVCACEGEQGAGEIGRPGACRWRPGWKWRQWGQEGDWLQICLLSSAKGIASAPDMFSEQYTWAASH